MSLLGMTYLGLLSCMLGAGIGIMGIFFDEVDLAMDTAIIFNLFGIALMIYGRNIYDHKEKMEKKYLEDRAQEMRKWPKRQRKD